MLQPNLCSCVCLCASFLMHAVLIAIVCRERGGVCMRLRTVCEAAAGR